MAIFKHEVKDLALARVTHIVKTDSATPKILVGWPEDSNREINKLVFERTSFN